jgi:neutral trehalase
LNNAKIKLAQDLKPVEKKDILNAENNVLKSENDFINAEANLINLQKERDNKIFDLQNQIDAQEFEIESKENQLELAKNEFKLLIEQEEKNLSNTNIDIQKTINTAFTDLRKYIINAQNYLNNIDEVF